VLIDILSKNFGKVQGMMPFIMLTTVFGNGTVWQLTAFPGFAGTY